MISFNFGVSQKLQIIFASLLAFTILSFLPFSRASASELDWKAYMTMGVVQTDQPLTSDNGFGPDVNYSSLSKVGLSGSMAIDDHWDGLINLVFRNSNSDIPYSPIDFAQVTYKASDNLTQFRAGIMKVQTWLISDYVNTGILYPWVRPPQEVYSLNPIGSLNLININRSLYADKSYGKLTIDIFGGGGAADIDVTAGVRAKTTRDMRILGGSLIYKNEGFLWRASSIRANGAFKGLVKATVPGSPTTEISIPLEFDLGDIDFWSTGIQADWGRFSFWSEYANERCQKVIDQRSSGYLTAGYHIDPSWMLHLTYSRLFESTFAPGSVFSATGNGKQNTTTVGVNWFITTNIMAKLEASRVAFQDGYALFSYTKDTTVLPTNGGPTSVNLYAASMDVSF